MGLKTQQIAPLLTVLVAFATAPGLALARPAETCLAAWRVAGVPDALGSRRINCRDGDPACDVDGTADGTCTISATLCLDVGGCAQGPIQSIRVDGRDAGAAAALLGELRAPVRGPEPHDRP